MRISPLNIGDVIETTLGDGRRVEVEIAKITLMPDFGDALITICHRMGGIENETIINLDTLKAWLDKAEWARVTKAAQL
jgi:hypothetical protein